MDIGLLHSAIAAVCPITGVSVDNPGDKQTWVVRFAGNATDQQKAAAQAAVDAFDPNTPAREFVSYVAMRLRLTIMERQAILTAAQSDWRLADWLGLAQAEGTINLSSAETRAAKVALVSAGLLTQGRADEVIAP
jgi:hypothetical protein